MAERMTVVVVPQNADGDGLTVGDAMRQVLDIFDLLSASNESEIVWRLVEATTNSPFKVIGEAESVNPNVNADAVAKLQKAEFASNYASLRKGIIPSAWQAGEPRKKAKVYLSAVEARLQKPELLLIRRVTR